MIWVESDLKDNLVPTPLPWAETLPTGTGFQNPIQPSLKHFQGWGTSPDSLGNLFQCSPHTHSKEFLPESLALAQALMLPFIISLLK